MVPPRLTLVSDNTRDMGSAQPGNSDDGDEAGIVGLYSVLAQVFPTQLRASGTGFAIGFGRGGAALAPILAGLLFQAGYNLQTVAIVMGSGSLIAAAALFSLRNVDVVRTEQVPQN